MAADAEETCEAVDRVDDTEYRTDIIATKIASAFVFKKAAGQKQKSPPQTLSLTS